MSEFDSDPRSNAELLQAIEDEKQELLKRDIEMKGKGFTHRVTWWNHHIDDEMGGDDIQADCYFSCDPLTLTIEDGEAWTTWRKILYESRSGPSGYDYTVISLPDPKPTEPCPTCKETHWMLNRTHSTWFCLGCGSVKDGEQSKVIEP